MRRPTVAALGAIIDSLRARGETLVLLSELGGIARDQAMPALPPSSATTRFLELGSYALVGASQDMVHFVFELAMFLALGDLPSSPVSHSASAIAIAERSRLAIMHLASP
ncbi:MAG: hypothetical protein ABIT38_24350 [Gemmatimonadaceae bacterium]